MAQQHVVRVGALGHVGRFRSSDGVCYPRGAEVVLRTCRGLEIGQVLASSEPTAAVLDEEGAILRGLTVEDRLLQTRLEKNRHEAYAGCVALLAEQRLSATLMDVEQLFDGKTLIFYFLGVLDPAVEALTDQLASVYDARAQLDKFAETLTAGCGPGCGTDSAQGCGSSCGGCALAGACTTNRT